MLILLLCVGLSMWYFAWKRSSLWGLKGLIGGLILYAVVAWAAPALLKIILAVIPFILFLAVVAAFFVVAANVARYVRR